MTSSPTPYVMPQLAVRRGREAVDFYVDAFGAREVYRVGGSDEMPSVVAQLDLGGSSIWVHDEAPEHGTHSPESLGGGTTRLLLVVDDPREVVDRAVARGSRLLMAPEEEHGWLVGRLVDPFGHHWEVGRPLEEWPPARGAPAHG